MLNYLPPLNHSGTRRDRAMSGRRLAGWFYNGGHMPFISIHYTDTVEIMTKLNELDETLQAINAQQTKALGEIGAKLGELNNRIADLEATLSTEELSPESQQALDAVIAGAQALDDIIPDAIVTTDVSTPADQTLTDQTPAEPVTDATADA